MTDSIRKRLSGNLESIRMRVRASCLRSNRVESDVTLIAVTKYAELNWVQELVNLGVIDLGESRPQQLMQRFGQLPDTVRWHMIGHLQRNKVADILPRVNVVHSVDSLRLFDCLEKAARNLPRPCQVLLEVNVSGEASKDGFTTEDLLSHWPKLAACTSMRIAGLMTMAPLSENPETARPVFRRLRELRDHLNSEHRLPTPMTELSMGMSGDFEIGIEEGATFIRVGSSLFDGISLNE